MEPYIVPQDKISLVNQIMLTGVLVLIASGILTLFLDRISDIVPITHSILTAAAWGLLPLIWIVLSLYELMIWSKIRYVLFEDSLHVQKKGAFGSAHEDLYRYDSVLSVSNASQGHGAYGTVTLRVSQHDDIILKHIAEPAVQAAKIKERVNKNRRATNFVA